MIGRPPWPPLPTHEPISSNLWNSAISLEQRNGIFSNLTVNFQGTGDDGIQLNMTINWKDRLEVNWERLLLSRLVNSPDLFKYIS